MNKKTILIVDDEASIRELFKTAFTLSGFDVITAENGHIALEILKENDIKVMFLDLKMPELSGIELCKMIRKQGSESFICAVTGFYNEFTPETVNDAGFDDYFFKPVSIEQLISTANEAFKRFE